jgi:hypothetical protein
VNHSQVVRAAYNEGKGIYKWGKRVGALGKDTVAVIRGEPRERDPWGRVRKREWEKPWVKNALGAAAAGAAVLGGTALLANHAPTRALFAKGVEKYRSWKNKIMPNAFAAKMTARLLSRRGRVIMLDDTASDWDVRDARGRSARVFAPGARARERREKRWHEKVDTQRRLLLAGGAAALLAGGVGGYALGKHLGGKGAVASEPSKIVNFPGFKETFFDDRPRNSEGEFSTQEGEGAHPAQMHAAYFLPQKETHYARNAALVAGGGLATAAAITPSGREQIRKAGAWVAKRITKKP